MHARDIGGGKLKPYFKLMRINQGLDELVPLAALWKGFSSANERYEAAHIDAGE